MGVGGVGVGGIDVGGVDVGGVDVGGVGVGGVGVGSDRGGGGGREWDGHGGVTMPQTGDVTIWHALNYH
ncbi:uncharacterized protein LACBIDRAFT_303497 [Laccaria bicolor S238N-H82]|uniref:Predicted protein n=1 Tax=Laccaria bicolor (strain S238N-H82 / ATCC MYA-4686) TaxID=486041 RepID=B0DJK9_LACBS|nr:uncharacterized protein LACBIDRAFT_303497 [Laccaria bicolor S238N-H82]EDR05227.1 predicted protein [Laccaria bicolor S238N-H82]|eukprot:XP_001884192.1 predicted protein [Laccaria bicolor S238N-H82]